MALWQDLPIELVFEVLSHLYRTIFLKATSLVCSELRGPSQLLLNRSIAIGTFATVPSPLSKTPEGLKDLPMYTRLAPLVDGSRTWRKPLFRGQLQGFVNDVLTKPRLFRRTTRLSIKSDWGSGSMGWIGRDDWTIEGGNVRMTQTSTDSGPKGAPVEVGESFKNAVSMLGISPSYATSRPASVALLVLLHSLTTIKSLNICVGPETPFDTIELASLGQLPGGVPLCIQNLQSLTLDSSSDTFEYSFIHLLGCLPYLRRLTCVGWDSPTKILSRRPPHESITPPSMPSLVYLILRNVHLGSADLVMLLEMLSDLEVFGYTPFPERGRPFDWSAFTKALKSHSHSLRTIRIWWDINPWDFWVVDMLPNPQDTLGPLSTFTSLTDLTIVPQLLFGKPENLGLIDDISQYLPPTLETVEFRLSKPWGLMETIKHLRLLEWPEQKSRALPKLKSLQLTHRDRKAAKSFVTGLGENLEGYLIALEKAAITFSPVLIGCEFTLFPASGIYGTAKPLFDRDTTYTEFGKRDPHYYQFIQRYSTRFRDVPELCSLIS